MRRMARVKDIWREKNDSAFLADKEIGCPQIPAWHPDCNRAEIAATALRTSERRHTVNLHSIGPHGPDTAPQTLLVVVLP